MLRAIYLTVLDLGSVLIQPRLRAAARKYDSLIYGQGLWGYIRSDYHFFRRAR
jgi:hypothetical protein